MQDSPEFLASRVDSSLEVVEFFHDDGQFLASRVIPCSFFELAEAGWHLLPTAAQLARAETENGPPVYGPAIYSTDRQVSVQLGLLESHVDSEHYFQAKAGKWYLAKVVIYSYLEPGTAVPPLPCKG